MSRLPAFLLKMHMGMGKYNTIAGLHVQADIIGHGKRKILARGLFTTPDAERYAKALAHAGTADPFELSFEDGERLQADFKIEIISYYGDFNGERTYELTLVSEGPINAL